MERVTCKKAMTQSYAESGSGYDTVFLETALLKYNSHTAQFTHLNCAIQWL